MGVFKNISEKEFAILKFRQRHRELFMKNSLCLTQQQLFTYHPPFVLTLKPKGKRRKTMILKTSFLENETELQARERDEAIAKYILEAALSQ